MTNKEKFLKVRACLTDTDLIAFIDERIAILDRKAEASKNATRKPSKTQVENETLKTDILGFVSNANGRMTIADVKNAFDLSSQKVTPLMNALVDENKLTKVVEKRVSYYSLA